MRAADNPNIVARLRARRPSAYEVSRYNWCIPAILRKPKITGPAML